MSKIENIEDIPEQYRDKAEGLILKIGNLADQLFPIISEIGSSIEIICDGVSVNICRKHKVEVLPSKPDYE